MYDFTFFTMPQGINRCKDTKKKEKKRAKFAVFFR